MKRLALAIATLASAHLAHAEPTLVMLSLDGLRHDARAITRAPALERIAREGASASRLTPTFPSNTFPGHVSLATGTHPDRHGILDNAFLDPKRGRFHYESDASWIEAEPLWIAAERQGVIAATYFWVGSETDWRGTRATHRIAPFDSGVSEAEKVDQILAWLDLPEHRRPRLIMSWWHGSDTAGHASGPDHPDVAHAIHAQAKELSRLLAGFDSRELWPELTLILVSDHGMTAVRNTVAVHNTLADAGIAARVHTGTSTAHFFLENPEDRAAAQIALSQHDQVAIYRRDELPPRLRIAHPTRAGDLVAIAEPGVIFREDSFGTRLLRALSWLTGRSHGMHGFDPAHPDMGGVFLAMGRGVAVGRELGEVHMIDVAPTAASLLNIAPPKHAEGRALQLGD